MRGNGSAALEAAKKHEWDQRVGRAMKRISSWGLALAALLGAGAAHATDIFSAAPAYPSAFSPVPYYNWTGLYVGANAGGGFSNPNWYDITDTAGGAYSATSGLIGGTIGYNAMTLAPFVFGEEVDLDVSRFHTTVSSTPVCAPGCEFRSDWVGTARLRFGVAIGNFLPYVTGGLSFAQLSTDLNGTPFGTQTKINLSWTAGVGLEYLLWDRWSAKIEYLFIDSSGITCDVACGQTLFPPTPISSGGFTQNSVSFNLHENVVRLGLNYRLWNFY
jgi:opacity protein-like surface antigen